MAEAVLHERQKLDGQESPDLAMDLMNLAASALYQERYPEALELAQRVGKALGGGGGGRLAALLPWSRGR